MKPTSNGYQTNADRPAAATERGESAHRYALIAPSGLHQLFRAGRYARIAALIALAAGAGCTANRWRPTPNTGGAQSAGDAIHNDSEHRLRGWFFDIGLNQYWPRLDWSEDLIHRLISVPNRALFPGQYRNVTTFGDARDTGSLTMPFVGIGKPINDHLTLSGHVMVGSRSLDSFQRLSGVFTLEVDFEAHLWAVGLQASLYPFGQVVHPDDAGLRVLLQAGRPSIDQTIEIEYLDGHGVGDFRVLGATLSKTTRSLADWNVSYNPGVSWEIPLDHRTSLIAGGSYHFHAYMPEELNGWNFALRLRIGF